MVGFDTSWRLDFNEQLGGNSTNAGIVATKDPFSGAMAVGINYGASINYPTASPLSPLSVYGGVCISSEFADSTAAPVDGLLVQSRVV